MDDGILGNIIRLEKQLQEQLHAERDRARDWQESELQALEAALAESSRNAEAENAVCLEASRKAVQAEVEDLVKHAEQWCARLTSLDESTLRELLMPRLRTILPEKTDDHPDGES